LSIRYFRAQKGESLKLSHSGKTKVAYFRQQREERGNTAAWRPKTQLWCLIEQVLKGDSFIIAKAGKPLVKVCRLDSPVRGQPMGSSSLF
jgi:hypothetical protein